MHRDVVNHRCPKTNKHISNACYVCTLLQSFLSSNICFRLNNIGHSQRKRRKGQVVFVPPFFMGWLVNGISLIECCEHWGTYLHCHTAHTYTVVLPPHPLHHPSFYKLVHTQKYSYGLGFSLTVYTSYNEIHSLCNQYCTLSCAVLYCIRNSCSFIH